MSDKRDEENVASRDLEGEEQAQAGSNTDSQDWDSTASEHQKAQLMLMSQFRIQQEYLGTAVDNTYRTVQRCDIIRQLRRNMGVTLTTILVAPPGHGKTTAALNLLQRDRFCTRPDISVTNANNFLRVFSESRDNEFLVVLDDFMGKTSLDDHGKWKKIVDFLQNFVTSNMNKRAILLCRSSILEACLSATGADLALITGKCNVVHLSIDNGSMFTDLLEEPKVDVAEPPPDQSPSIGFPLCCKLAPHLPPCARDVLFQRPRLALQLALKELMLKSEVARVALSLLAVSYTSLNAYTFLNAEQFPQCPSLKALEILTDPAHPVTTRQIAQYYLNLGGLVVVADNVISFACEAIREEVLLLLCYSNIQFVATFCELNLISQIVLASRDEAHQEKPADRPVLKESAMSAFLQRILREMDSRNYRETLTSPLFQHQSFRDIFEEAMQEKERVNGWVGTCDRDGLHFLFWAGACDLVLKQALNCLKKENKWEVCQALVGSCYWGKESATKYLLQLFQKKPKLKRLLREARLQDIVTGNLAGLQLKDAPNWELAPFHPEDTLLTLAAWRGHDAVVRLFADRDWPVDSPGKDQRTALMHYCARANETMAKYLLSKEADPHAVDTYGMTPLLYSVYRKEWNLPNELLSAGAVAARNRASETPLTAACASGWGLATIQEMIKQGADPLVSDEWNNNCLHYACFNGQLDVVKFLLQKTNLRVDAQNFSLNTPMGLAGTTPKREDVFDMLLKLRQEEFPTKDEETVQTALKEIIVSSTAYSDSQFLAKCATEVNLNAEINRRLLIVAFWNSNLEAIKLYLDILEDPGSVDSFNWMHYVQFIYQSGSFEGAHLLYCYAPPEEKESLCTTILLGALDHGQLDLVKNIVQFQTEPMAAAFQENPVLFIAVLSDSALLLDFCLKQPGVDIDCVDQFNNTPLLWALKNNKRCSARYLLCRGADPSKSDVEGFTCLHSAASNGYSEVVEYLLHAKNVHMHRNTSSNAGITPLMSACERGHADVVKLLGVDKESLKNTNPFVPHGVELAVLNGHTDVVSACLPYLEEGLETRCRGNNTPLHLAAEKGDLNMFQWLLFKGADKEAVNDKGETPLMLACKGGHV